MGGLDASFAGRLLKRAAGAASGGGGRPPGAPPGDGNQQETPEQRVDRIHAEAAAAMREVERKDMERRAVDHEYDKHVRASIQEHKELVRRTRNAW